MLAKVKKFVCAGAVIVTQKNSSQWSEDDLWNGFPEETSSAYFFKNDDSTGQAYRKQFKFNVINLLFMNLYGPKDIFNLKQSNIIHYN